MPVITASRFAAATSVLALAVAMGGTGYAAAKIKTNQIAKNAITSKLVKNDNLTGKDIKESSLAKVPSAGTADSATSAASVGGVKISKVDYRAATGAGGTTIFQGSGLTITASCPGGSPALNATTSVNGSFISTVVVGDVTPPAADPLESDTEGDAFSTATNFNLLVSGNGNVNVATFNYRNPNGGVVTGQLSADGNVGIGGISCSVNGMVTAG
jgi:hypothetical protein